MDIIKGMIEQESENLDAKSVILLQTSGVMGDTGISVTSIK